MSERACPWPECTCTHTHPCFKGWMEGRGAKAVPCPNCRPSLWGVLQFVGDPGTRSAADSALIRQRTSRTDWKPEDL